MDIDEMSNIEWFECDFCDKNRNIFSQKLSIFPEYQSVNWITIFLKLAIFIPIFAIQITFIEASIFNLKQFRIVMRMFMHFDENNKTANNFHRN